MLLPRPTEAQATYASRPPQAFVADYDDVIGAVARVTEDAVRPGCQRAVQWASSTADRVAGRTLVGADTVTRASGWLARGTGMAIMGGGAAFAAEACQGALANARQAETARHAWTRLTQGPATEGAERRFAAKHARRASFDRLTHLLGAGGGAAMSATLLCSATLLGAVTGARWLMAGAATSALLYERCLPKDVRLHARDATAAFGSLRGAHDSRPPWQRRAEMASTFVAYFLAVVLWVPTGSPVALACLSALFLAAAAGRASSATQRAAAGQRVVQMITNFGHTGRTGVMAAVSGALCGARLLGASAPMLNAACLGAAIVLMGSYALANIVTAVLSARDRRQTHRTIERAAARVGGEPAEHIRGEVATRFARARWGDVGIALGGVTMMAGLVGQTVALWPGVAAILLGSVAMECARYGRDALVPAFHPGPLLTRRQHVDETTLTQRFEDLSHRLALRQQIVDNRRTWRRQRGYRQWLFGTKQSRSLETQLGVLLRKLPADVSLAHGAQTASVRADNAQRTLDGLNRWRPEYGHALSHRLEPNDATTLVADPVGDKQYKQFFTAAIDTLRFDVVPLTDARIADDFQEIATHPSLWAA